MCSNHGKEVTLFCKETQCQTLICCKCLEKHHLKHPVVDAGEYQKKELLDNLTSAVESLSFKEDQITTVQKKNERCVEKLKKEKNSILSLVRNKYDSLIRQAANQTEESRNEMTSLEENLVLLNNIKQYAGRETPSLREIQNYQETVSSVTENNPTPFELHFMEYTENKDIERLVEELCGELKRENALERLVKQSELTRNNPGTRLKQSEKTGKRPEKSAGHSQQIEMDRTNALTLSLNQHLPPRFKCKL